MWQREKRLKFLEDFFFVCVCVTATQLGDSIIYSHSTLLIPLPTVCLMKMSVDYFHTIFSLFYSDQLTQIPFP